MQSVQTEKDPLHLISGTAGRILDSAQSLIRDRGYNGFSYADIADVIGIRKASIHHHFPSKTQLGQAVVARYRADVARAMAELDAGLPSARERIAALIGYWENCIRDRSAPFCVCVQLAAELPALPEEIADEVRLHFRTITDWAAQTLKAGERDGSLKLARPAAEEADCFIAALHGALISARALGTSPAAGERDDDGARIFTSITGEQLRRLSP